MFEPRKSVSKIVFFSSCGFENLAFQLMRRRRSIFSVQAASKIDFFSSDSEKLDFHLFFNGKFWFSGSQVGVQVNGVGNSPWVVGRRVFFDVLVIF